MYCIHAKIHKLYHIHIDFFFDRNQFFLYSSIPWHFFVKLSFMTLHFFLFRQFKILQICLYSNEFVERNFDDSSSCELLFSLSWNCPCEHYFLCISNEFAHGTTIKPVSISNSTEQNGIDIFLMVKKKYKCKRAMTTMIHQFCHTFIINILLFESHFN